MERMELCRAGKRTDKRQMGQEDRTTKDREKFQLVGNRQELAEEAEGKEEPEGEVLVSK